MTTDLSSRYMYFAKYDENRACQWAKSIGEYDSWGYYAHGIGITDNLLILSGNYSKDTDFDPGSETSILNGVGNQDCFIAHFNFNGEYIWAGSIAGNSYESINAIAIVDTAIYLTGYYQETTDLDPDTKNQNTSTSSSNDRVDMFATKYYVKNMVNTSVKMPKINSSYKIILYPNPTKNILFISSNTNIFTKIEICDLTGRNIKQLEYNSQIDISNLSSEIYYIKLYSQNSYVEKTFIIE